MHTITLNPPSPFLLPYFLLNCFPTLLPSALLAWLLPSIPILLFPLTHRILLHSSSPVLPPPLPFPALLVESSALLPFFLLSLLFSCPPSCCALPSFCSPALSPALQLLLLALILSSALLLLICTLCSPPPSLLYSCSPILLSAPLRIASCPLQLFSSDLLTSFYPFSCSTFSDLL